MIVPGDAVKEETTGAAGPEASALRCWNTAFACWYRAWAAASLVGKYLFHAPPGEVLVSRLSIQST